jgi:hypothetical protein
MTPTQVAWNPGLRLAAIVASLVAVVATATAFGQVVPDGVLDGIAFDEPMPARFTTGEIYWLSGSIDSDAILALTFEFISEKQTLEHRALVVDGRFKHPLIFKHADSGEHTFRIAFFPVGDQVFYSEPYAGIEIAQGEGAIERPWEYFDSFFDNAYFRPNAIQATAGEYPPLFVSTGGRVESVVAYLPDGAGGEYERVLLDDGMAGDLKAGDGVYTMTGEPYYPPDFEMGPFGSVAIRVRLELTEGVVHHWTAECGIVEEAAVVQKLSDDAFRADHVVNLVDDGTLFVLSQPFVDLRAIGRRFYQHFSDDYDFLVVRSSMALSNGLHGLSTNVHNDIKGIGLPELDLSEEFGSAGRLQSATFINFCLLGPLVHEIAHNWANHLSEFGDCFWGGHWGLSNVQGVLGGNATYFESVGDGAYAVPGDATTSSWGGRYSMLELYLMGLVAAEEVPSYQVLADPSIVAYDANRERLIVAGELNTVSIREVIDSNGARSPNVNGAPKSFRMATVVVSDRPLSATELSYQERQAEWFGSDEDNDFAFAAATGYRATMDTRLGPTITAVVSYAAASGQVEPPTPELLQNYPNPFNGSTVLRYALPSAAGTADAANSAIEIYATNGQRVRRMAVQGIDGGAQQVIWDGTDGEGRPLATGVYIACLRVGDTVATRKVTLVR